MSFTTAEFLARAELDPASLQVWIEEGWLVPATLAEDPAFDAVDLARAQLIRDLMQDLGVNAEGVGVILGLLDQVHGLRKALAAVAADRRL